MHLGFLPLVVELKKTQQGNFNLIQEKGRIKAKTEDLARFRHRIFFLQVGDVQA